MRAILETSITVLLVVLHPVCFDWTWAEAADRAPTIAMVEQQVRQLDQRLNDIEEEATALKEQVETFGKTIDEKVRELKELGADPSQLSDEGRKRVDALLSGVEDKQLEALEGAEKLGDEGVLLCGFSAKESGHDSVRRKAIESIGKMGEKGFPAVALAFKSMTAKEKIYLVEQLAKQRGENRFLGMVAMARNADGKLLAALLDSVARSDNPPVFIAAIIGEGGGAIGELLKVQASLEDKDRLVLLYAVAKKGGADHVLAAVKAAGARKDKGLPVVAAAFRSRVVEARAEVVRQAKRMGGEVGDFIVNKALEENDDDLRKAAEDALKK